MERSINDVFLQECKTGWLLVQEGFGGKLNDIEKLKYALQCTGRNPSQKSVNNYWTQNGGSVSFTQFCGIMKRESPPTLEDLVTLFKMVDKNGDGLISATELTKLLTKKGEPMTEREAQEIIDGMNFNEEGKLDYTEFCHSVMETADDCLRAAHLKVREKLHDVEDQWQNKRIQKGAGTSVTSSSVDSRQSREEGGGTEEHDSAGTRNSSKKEGTKTKAASSRPAVIYPTGSEGPATAVDDDDVSSDLPAVTPTSVDSMSPLSSVPSTDVPEVSLVKPSVLPTEISKDEKLIPLEQEKDESNGQTVASKGSGDEELHETPVQKTEVENLGESSTLEHKSGSSHSVESVDEKPPPSAVEQEQSTKESNDENLSVSEEIQEELEESLESKEPLLHNNDDQQTELEKDSKEPSDSTQEDVPIDGRQPDLLASPVSDPIATVEGFNSFKPCMSAAPKPPKDLETWNSIEGKGCFYVNATNDTIESHQYTLCLSSPTHVWVEISATPPADPLADISLYIFHMNEQEEPTQVITHTQHFVTGSKWVCRLDLDEGHYLLLPFTSGCWLQMYEEDEEGEGIGDVPLVDEKDGKIVLTPDCRRVFEEIFVRHDLDGNDAISKNEFDFFNERTSKESCDEDSWKAILDYFSHNEDGELTLSGFLDLHEANANDEDGGEPELWKTLEAMGYNKQLKLTKACPFSFEVHTKDCDGEIEILPIASSAVFVDPVLVQLAKDRGTKGTVKDGGDNVIMHSLVTSHLATIVVESKLHKKCLVQIDCSQSEGYYVNSDSTIRVVELDSNTTEIGYHLLSKDPKKASQIVFTATLIKN